MRLLNLHVENFGALHDYRLEFSRGLQVLHHENGWGKSTLAVFIKAMFFGLPATSKRSLDENERKKYTPWQGGAFGGSLEFECAKGKFRIERSFGDKEKDDSFALYDLSTKRPSEAYSERVGAELFGIDASGFERSVYLSQRALDSKGGNAEISARLGNLLDDVDDIGSYDVAREILEKRRRHYVMTGNRGAVAALEQEIPERERELEDCRRKEEALQVQESELNELREQLEAMEKLLLENRAEMQRAALAREHAALIERKNAMLNELSELSRQKRVLRDFFGGFPPSTQEFEHQVGLFEKIKETRARLSAIPETPSEPEQRAALKRAYPSGVPTSAELELWFKENEELRQTVSRLEALQRVRGAEETEERFPKGAPSASRIEAANASLGQIDRLRADIADADQRQNDFSGVRRFSIPSAVCFGIGAILMGIFLLVQNIPVALAIGGGALLLAAVALLAVSLVMNGKKKKLDKALAEQIAEWEAQCKKAEGAVKSLLEEYGMSVASPAASLAELSLLTAQYRERQSRQSALMEEGRSLEQRRRALSAGIRSALSRFVKLAEFKNDYSAELNILRRDGELLLRLEQEERKRLYDRAAAEAVLEDLNRQFMPFLRRYDPKGAYQPNECLEIIGEKREEYVRVCKEITRRENDLKLFIAEKKLDEISAEAPTSYERLVEQEKALGEKIAELQRKKTVVKSTMDRLRADVDRIPELTAQIDRAREQLRVSKANYDTIVHTMALLEDSKAALSTRYLDGMQDSFADFLAMLVGDEAPESMMDDSFEVRMQGGGKTRTMESFSRGWRDAVQFCIRLSLTEALFAEGAEKPFLLLDDPFVNLDDARMGAARRMLNQLAESYQIVYMVCHKDRA